MSPVPGFGARLWAEARDDLSLALVAALVITLVLLRALAPAERSRVRGMTVLTALHLILLPVLASLRGASSDWYNDVRLAALIFETLAFVGMAAALKARQVVENVRTCLAIELLVAAQAIELRRPLRPAARVAEAHRVIRQRVAPLDGDRELHYDIEAVCSLVDGGALDL